ncbi:MAG: hypothetical protein PVH61_31050 [Candidatus Aminicenantes bacterium]|jgi:hypothetical protein
MTDYISIISLIISAASLITTIGVATFVYIYNKKAIRFQNTRDLINSWQSFNQLIIADEKNIDAIGEFYESSTETKNIRKLYLLFYLLNILQHEYYSAKTNMADESLAIKDIKAQIIKLSSDKEFVIRHIQGRGFEEDFVNFVIENLNFNSNTKAV